MGSRYSIAEARNQLPRLVHEAERGEPVQLTRRGQPVAVLISQASFERMTGQQSFWKAMSALRSSLDFAGLGIDPASLADTRDATAGREVAL